MALQKFVQSVSKSSDIPKTEAKFALDYLQYYYVAEGKKKFVLGDVKKTTKVFQQRAGLTVNGKLDGPTLKAMQWPRCGCRDNAPANMLAASHNSAKWGPLNLTYFVEKYVNGISRNDQDDLLELAYQQWEDHCQLTITRVMSKSKANMLVSTGQGRRDNFDGPGSTLAWAYLPPIPNYNGQLQMKFDIDETWIANARDRGILFLNVACHEFGHFLGLGHSRAQRALMAPFYSAGITKPQQNDDIPRIQGLYGQPKDPVPPVDPPVPPVDPPVPPVDPPTPGNNTVQITGIKDLDQIKINGRKVADFSLI